ncbi:MAG TPA: tetratricopeptide repeat protein [Tepidisphaeraceae bacterium]|nr:tetratricopeptide repeat protein [Tepidisphaeraceae bacterium]
MAQLTIDQALQLAIQQHQAGRLENAESLYRQILSIDPRQPDATHLLGVLLHQRGKHGEAENMIRLAIEISPAAEYYSNLAAVLEVQGRSADALDAHRTALATNPNSPAAHNNYGSLLQQSGKFDEAQAEFRRAMALNPHYPEAHLNLGNLLRELGRHAESLAEYQSALRLRPNYADAQLNEGLALWKLGRMEDATAAFSRATQLRPSFPEAYLHLALLCEQLGRPADTIRAAGMALSQRPYYPEAFSTLGNALKSERKLDEAIAAYRESLRLRPDSAEVLSSLGAALQDRGDLDEAVAAQQQALALRPVLPEAYVNLATACREAGRFDDANDACIRAVELRPGYAEAEWNLGLGRLLEGNLKEGWELYEARLRVRGLVAQRPFRQPLWEGSPLDGKTILLHAEQGFGDTIQFVRYAPLVADRGGRIVLQCPSALKRLLSGQLGIECVISESDPLPTFDVHCPLMSLGRVFGTTLESIRNKVPYLKADADEAERWRERLAADAPGLKVGLVWAGRETHKNDRNRSIRLADLAPLVERGAVSGVRFYSLQKREPAGQLRTTPIGDQIIDYTDQLNDFADTAAFISNLDLVIAVDTAVAHLAGALAKPVWLLLPYSPDWRWMLGRSDSPWYPTIRLFRQSKRKDWHDPLEQIAVELDRLA